MSHSSTADIHQQIEDAMEELRIAKAQRDKDEISRLNKKVYALISKVPHSDPLRDTVYKWENIKKRTDPPSSTDSAIAKRAKSAAASKKDMLVLLFHNAFGTSEKACFRDPKDGRIYIDFIDHLMGKETDEEIQMRWTMKHTYDGYMSKDAFHALNRKVVLGVKDDQDEDRIIDMFKTLEAAMDDPIEFSRIEQEYKKRFDAEIEKLKKTFSSKPSSSSSASSSAAPREKYAPIIELGPRVLDALEDVHGELPSTYDTSKKLTGVIVELIRGDDGSNEWIAFRREKDGELVQSRLSREQYDGYDVPYNREVIAEYERRMKAGKDIVYNVANDGDVPKRIFMEFEMVNAIGGKPMMDTLEEARSSF